MRFCPTLYIRCIYGVLSRIITIHTAITVFTHSHIQCLHTAIHSVYTQPYTVFTYSHIQCLHTDLASPNASSYTLPNGHIQSTRMHSHTRTHAHTHTHTQEARPLLSQSIKLVEEVTPLLRELREGGLVANVEALTSTAAAAAADIQKLQVCV
jgi:hypothetical protein